MTGVNWGRLSAAWMVVAAVAGTIAYACAGGGPGPGSWDPQQSSAILSPANDTRQNLLLLLADRYGTPTADPQAMAQGIVPIEFPWSVMEARLSPPVTPEEHAAASWDSTAFTRCHSNGSGSAQFVAAVRTAAGMSAAEKEALVAAREALRPTCDGTPIDPSQPQGLTAPAALEFAAYLAGAELFYRGEFEPARVRFGALSTASDPWLRETALYMVARSELNRAQAGSFDEYGSLADPEKRDRESIAHARAALAAYLQAYPSGRYAASAQGLMRRVAWLAGDRRALGAAYSSLVGSPAAKDGGGANIGLIDEIDIKLLPPGDGSGITDPTLLAVVDLMRLRQDGRERDYDWGYRGKKLERAELEAQRPLFKSDPALFEYLLAVEAFHGRGQPKEVLALIPDAAHQKRFSYVQFSRQMLRGFALEALKDRNARGFWLSLIPGAVQPYQREAVELALAQYDARAKAPERLFGPDSPLRSPLIRQRMLEEHAGPALLRQQARTGATPHEREVSLYLLLAGELHHGLYTDFLRDMAMVGDRKGPQQGEIPGAWSVQDYDPLYSDVRDGLGRPPLYVFAPAGSDDLAPCPDIRATAIQLAANPAAIRPRLCLAEFIRRKGFDGWSETYDPQYNVIKRPRGFSGEPLERIDIYRSVIGSAAASADDKAFALNRAVRCFAPAGSSSCGGNDIPVAQRKAWFERLKRDYPQSPWARDLKVYW